MKDTALYELQREPLTRESRKRPASKVPRDRQESNNMYYAYCNCPWTRFVLKKSADRGLRRRQDAGTGEQSHSLVEEGKARTHGFPALCISTNLGGPRAAQDSTGLGRAAFRHCSDTAGLRRDDCHCRTTVLLHTTLPLVYFGFRASSYCLLSSSLPTRRLRHFNLVQVTQILPRLRAAATPNERVSSSPLLR